MNRRISPLMAWGLIALVLAAVAVTVGYAYTRYDEALFEQRLMESEISRLMAE